MINLLQAEHQIHCVTNFQDLVSIPFQGEINAICWNRKLRGDFSEIVKKIELKENISVLEEEELQSLQLSEQGQLAREILLNDLKLLKVHGASPILNLISCYERDDAYPFFSTDVYSFHVDRSPVPVDTFLCTYHGEPSDILPNAHAIQKVLVPEIRDELRRLHGKSDDSFESFLSEHFYDLHYQAKTGARPISLGSGNLWRLAVDHPGSQVAPCVHRTKRKKWPAPVVDDLLKKGRCFDSLLARPCRRRFYLIQKLPVNAPIVLSKISPLLWRGAGVRLYGMLH